MRDTLTSAIIQRTLREACLPVNIPFTYDYSKAASLVGGEFTEDEFKVVVRIVSEINLIKRKVSSIELVDSVRTMEELIRIQQFLIALGLPIYVTASAWYEHIFIRVMPVNKQTVRCIYLLAAAENANIYLPRVNAPVRDPMYEKDLHRFRKEVAGAKLRTSLYTQVPDVIQKEFKVTRQHGHNILPIVLYPAMLSFMKNQQKENLF